MKKSLFILLTFATILAFTSCSTSNNEPPVVENNELVNTVWKRQYIGNMGGGLIGYETLKFPSNEDIVRTWEDLNGVTREYRWIGKYRIEGEKIICTVRGDLVLNEHVELIKKNNNTICIPSDARPGECFVKQ